MDKKTILVGTLEEKKYYSKLIKYFDIRTETDLIDFSNSKLEHGFFHGNNIEEAMSILKITEDKPFLLIDNTYFTKQVFNKNITNINMLEEFNNYIEHYPNIFNQDTPDVDMLDIVNKNKIKIVDVGNPIELENFKNEILKDINNSLPTLKEFKAIAKENKEQGKYKSLGESLNALAKEYGYKEYRAIKPILEQNKVDNKEDTDEWKAFYNDNDLDNDEIYNKVEDFKKDIQEIKNIDNSNFSISCVSAIYIISYVVTDKISTKEILEILNDKDKGIPTRKELENFKNEDIFKRVEDIYETIVNKSGYKTNPKTYDESQKVIKKVAKTSFRDLENKGKRKKF